MNQLQPNTEVIFEPWTHKLVTMALLPMATQQWLRRQLTPDTARHDL